MKTQYLCPKCGGVNTDPEVLEGLVRCINCNEWFKPPGPASVPGLSAGTAVRFSIVADTKKNKQTFSMRNWTYSFRHRKDRLKFYTAIMILTTTILVFATFFGVLIQEKVQISDNISKQQTNPTAVPSNAGNSLEPIAILNAGNNASTNILLLLTPSVISVTNSN
ncbi:MAG: hypothetical protein ABSF10_00260 [Verrucomicrobiota bacterium]